MVTHVITGIYAKNFSSVVFGTFQKNFKNKKKNKEFFSQVSPRNQQNILQELFYQLMLQLILCIHFYINYYFNSMKDFAINNIPGNLHSSPLGRLLKNFLNNYFSMFATHTAKNNLTKIVCLQFREKQKCFFQEFFSIFSSILSEICKKNFSKNCFVDFISNSFNNFLISFCAISSMCLFLIR